MNTKIKYLSSNLTDQEAIRIKVALYRSFEEEQVFTNKNLCLKLLADKLSTNTKYLSQVINQETNNNFQVLMNRYRIALFQKRMLEGATLQLTFYGLARECGFNNRSTFYRAFKEITGMTPSNFYLQQAA